MQPIIPPHITADPTLILWALTLVVLLGPITMPILRKLGTLINWLVWRLALTLIELARDEIIKAILAAIAGSTGLAGLFHFFS